MSRSWSRILLCAVLLGTAWPSLPQSGKTDVRFAALDIYLETAQPLAAWQFELRESSGQMRVVGVENGDSAAFGDAPYYDLAAVSKGAADRIIVADYSTSPAEELPTGRGRIATVHVRLDGPSDPDYVLILAAAGGTDGEPIKASIELDAP